jgi:formylglycine-generating enzyme required for sulfatase activity
MSSLADLPELVGFFSYSREDDADSQGALSALRYRIQGELRGQLGRTAKTFRLWQDKEAIASGTLWETEIKSAATQAVFFIPIITPTVIASPYCRFELDSFLAREATLGRNDLVFPILYIDVPALDDDVPCQSDPVLSLIAQRQYLDWRDYRYLDVNSVEVRKKVAAFCKDIRDALERRQLSSEERKEREEDAAHQRAEAERKRGEANAKGGAHRIEEEEDHVPLRRHAGVRWQRPTVIGSLIVALIIGAMFIPRVFAPRAPVPTIASIPVVTSPSAVPVSVPAQVAPAPVSAAPVRTVAYALTPERERTLRPKDTFKECTNCPEMVVLPSGSYTMGSPPSERGRWDFESPQHIVTIAKPFAVGKFDVTFDEWAACAAGGGCDGYKPPDQGWGRGRRPVINVTWYDAKAYVTWLVKTTGKTYRLLSESEWEYAARAGTTTAYYWGDNIGTNNANCESCGSQWDNQQTAPVGSFSPNQFGLSDMAGNVDQWLQDCFDATYDGAPADGSAWISGDCTVRIVRGGYLYSEPSAIRSASRGRLSPGAQGDELSFRVGRTLGQ